MLYEERSNQELDEYAKERCDEIEQMYNELKSSIVRLVIAKDELDKFNALTEITSSIGLISFEHLDTSDRYIRAYEDNKHLENVITKLKEEEES